jgi:hypothetical protein
MTKLEELKADAEAAWVTAAEAARVAAVDADDNEACYKAADDAEAAYDAWDAYQDELEKQEKPND